MKRPVWIAVFVATMVCNSGLNAESCCQKPAADGWIKQFAPAGGWCPYGGGLLHWWPRHCFPRCGGPDDYCRKKLPRLCWPPYPPYYIWGPPPGPHP
jgi:hypothetical protein